MKSQVGLIGLGVMGSNLIKNVESRGYPCVVYNRTYSVTEKFLAENQGRQFQGTASLEQFTAALISPRRILIMVKAGRPVDLVTDSLLELTEAGDVIADLGNSYFKDTEIREKRCRQKGVYFLGVGVSGGEEGALKGPSIMPGGEKKAWKLLANVFDDISAKAPEPCHTYIGPGGAGHFVKMVHNGIEYADMQLIAESYHILKSGLGLTPPELAKIFAGWNEGVLSSYLIEITSRIFTRKEPDGGYLVDKILDKASQKGTGKWTAQTALDIGAPVPAISSAVDARFLSALKSERLHAEKVIGDMGAAPIKGEKKELIDCIHDALYASKVIAYAQGMAMICAASKNWEWNLNLSKIASIWRGGCIIRARFLNEIMRVFEKNPGLPNMLLDPPIKEELQGRIPALRKIVSLATLSGIPVPGFGSSLAYFDSYRRGTLPQNLTQAQRDFFGAHTYERIDQDGIFHTEWE